MSMVSACAMNPRGLTFLLLLLFIEQAIPSHIGKCFNKFYLSDDACNPCPSHCEICANATQCALCQIGFYGQICEKACHVGCTGTCHQVYGHCTYGCEDGEYPDTHSPACLNCSNDCTVCTSLTSCVECKDGYYGETCGTRCSELCKSGLCNSTDGLCFDCRNGSYKVDKDCVVCPDGCAHCNDSHTCTVCTDGFIGPIHGSCLLKCQDINKADSGYICNTGFCRNLKAYWNLSSNECHQAVSHPSGCFTEGVCVTLKDSLINMDMTSYDDLEDSLLYNTFKCLLVCREQTTRNKVGSCEGQICKDICVVEESAYGNASELADTIKMVDKPPAETWVKFNCPIVASSSSTEKSFTTAYALVGVFTVLVILPILAIRLIRRRRLAKQKHSNEKIPDFNTKLDKGQEAKLIENA